MQRYRIPRRELGHQFKGLLHTVDMAHPASTDTDGIHPLYPASSRPRAAAHAFRQDIPVVRPQIVPDPCISRRRPTNFERLRPGGPVRKAPCRSQ